MNTSSERRRPGRRLTVTGHGRASQPPDQADVTLGVEAVRGTATEARSAAADAMNSVVAALAALGIPAADIRTADLSLAPEIEYRPQGGPKHVGFRLTNRVTIRVRDTAQIADVIDRAIGAGATSLDGVRFRVADEGAARRAALAAAVDDARAAAETLAAAAGAVIGDVVRMREVPGDGPGPIPRLAMLEAKAADTPVLGGTTDVAAAAEVTWTLEGPET